MTLKQKVVRVLKNLEALIFVARQSWSKIDSQEAYGTSGWWTVDNLKGHLEIA